MFYVLDKNEKKEVAKIFNENFNAIFQVCRATMEICHNKTGR
jgi:hypothetical protein